MKEWEVRIKGHLILNYKTKVRARTKKEAIDIAFLKLGKRSESIKDVIASPIAP